MTTASKSNIYGDELERLLLLRTSPVAVKMLSGEEDIPEGAVRPKRDRGYHLAQCQAFAMSRRQGVMVAMLQEDNWCWAPLIAYGLAEPPEGFLEGKSIIPTMIENPEAAGKLAKTFPRLEYGKYIGIVSGPLRTANFKPDLVLVYSNTAQLRSMLMAVKYKEGILIESQFDPIDSCVYSVVPVILSGQYRITLPDPGDYERAMAGEDEIIFSVPGDKMATLVAGLKYFAGRKAAYTNFTMDMRPDFPRPDFYKRLFKMWDLDVED